jgi:hypothetical protein
MKPNVLNLFMKKLTRDKARGFACGRASRL